MKLQIIYFLQKCMLFTTNLYLIVVPFLCCIRVELLLVLLLLLIILFFANELYNIIILEYVDSLYTNNKQTVTFFTFKFKVNF